VSELTPSVLLLAHSTSYFSIFFSEVFLESSIYLTIQNHTLRSKTISLPLMHAYKNTFLTLGEEHKLQVQTVVFGVLILCSHIGRYEHVR